jgi:hypothetical protein
LQKVKLVDNDGSVLGFHLEPIGRKVRTVFKSNTAMINHLMRHRKKGHTVPEDALDRLRDPEDAAENRAIWRRYEKVRRARAEGGSSGQTGPQTAQGEAGNAGQGTQREGPAEPAEQVASAQEEG